MRAATDPRLMLLFLPVRWWAQQKRRLSGNDPREARLLSDTEVVIDGYPGSANSFLTSAFLHAQGRPVRVAHHLHAPLTVVEAGRLGIPSLVTLRKPEDAAFSVVTRWPHVSLPQALRHYAAYYDALEGATNTFVLTPFAATTRRPDLVIEMLNARFGTSFAPFPLSDESLDAVRPMTPQLAAEMERRKVIKEVRKAELDLPASKRWLARARAVYERRLADAPPELIGVGQ